jgi:hypothetical protein
MSRLMDFKCQAAGLFRPERLPDNFHKDVSQQAERKMISMSRRICGITGLKSWFKTIPFFEKS